MVKLKIYLNIHEYFIVNNIFYQLDDEEDSDDEDSDNEDDPIYDEAEEELTIEEISDAIDPVLDPFENIPFIRK